MLVRETQSCLIKIRIHFFLYLSMVVYTVHIDFSLFRDDNFRVDS